ncbi:MAG: serine/threonine protein kinase [Cyanosarcina radialis HA8281-LM2]|jgi:serine/threonine protein kinase|nr:serine/threonine protein kinase [Cyanosarcina radialis HA8281-LM2]
MTDDILNNRYQIDRLLGKNSGRKTLLARDLETQELVVIKLLSFSSDFEWDDLKLFEREAETLKALSHPFIPKYLNYFEVDSATSKAFALVQTYVEGSSLEQHLKAGRTFTEVELQEIARSVLEILIYLHDRQPPVIHRDIKPSNILLTNRSGNSIGEVYLVDFGSVQTIATRESKTFTVVGTYGYMPLEQFGGRTVPASDLYSLGATLIYLVTGTHPADLPQKDFRMQFEDAANIDPTFANWLKWMTEPNLERRLTSAKAALAALLQPRQIVKSPRGITSSIVNKPANSKIFLVKTVKSLEIIIPYNIYRISLAGAAFLFVFGLVFLIFAISLPSPFLVIAFISYCPIVLLILVSVFPQNKVSSIGKLSLSTYFGRLQIKYKVPKAQADRHSIIGKVRDIKEITIRYDAFGKAAALIIQKNTIAFELIPHLGKVVRLEKISSEEIEWLAYELSDWLKVPITAKLTSLTTDL